MNSHRKSLYGGDRYLYNFAKQQLAISEKQTRMQALKTRPKTNFIARLWTGVVLVWNNFVKWTKKLLTPTRKTAVQFSRDTVPIGFEYAYDCCGAKLKPVHAQKRKGGRFYWHHFHCLSCGSTTVERFKAIS